MVEPLLREIVDERKRNDAGDDVGDEAVHRALTTKVEVQHEISMGVGGVELRRVDNFLVLVPVVGDIRLAERLLAVTDAR